MQEKLRLHVWKKWPTLPCTELYMRLERMHNLELPMLNFYLLFLFIDISLHFIVLFIIDVSFHIFHVKAVSYILGS